MAGPKHRPGTEKQVYHPFAYVVELHKNLFHKF